jgi:hypothetical protein
MVGDLRMWLYRATPATHDRCVGADHSPPATGRRTPKGYGSILSSNISKMAEHSISESWLKSTSKLSVRPDDENDTRGWRCVLAAGSVATRRLGSTVPSVRRGSSMTHEQKALAAGVSERAG